MPDRVVDLLEDVRNKGDDVATEQRRVTREKQETARLLAIVWSNGLLKRFALRIRMAGKPGKV
jgi:hypothetical protein